MPAFIANLPWMTATVIAMLLFTPFYVVFPLVAKAGLAPAPAIGLWCFGIGATTLATSNNMLVAATQWRLALGVLATAVTFGAIANLTAVHAMVSAPNASTPTAIIGMAAIAALPLAFLLYQIGWHPLVTLRWNHSLAILLAIASVALAAYRS